MNIMCCFHYVAIINNAAWTFTFKFLCKHCEVSGVYLQSGIASSHAYSMFNLLRTIRLFSKAVGSFKIPITMYKGSNFSLSSLTFLIICLFVFSSYSEYEVVSHCGYDSVLFIQVGICVNLTWALMYYKISWPPFLLFFVFFSFFVPLIR